MLKRDVPTAKNYLDEGEIDTHNPAPAIYWSRLGGMGVAESPRIAKTR